MDSAHVRLAWQLFQLNWIAVAGMGTLLATALLAAGFTLEPIGACATVTVAGSLVATAYLLRLVLAERADPKLVFSLGSIGQIMLIVAIVGPLSYAAGTLNWPLQDQALLAIDRALGFDPERLLRFVNLHPWLSHGLDHGYAQIKWQLLEIPIVLALTGRIVRLQSFVLAMTFALLVTIVISAVLPAVGTLYALHLSAAELPGLNSAIYSSQPDIFGVRNGSLRDLNLFTLAGIVTFPSFHAASAVLYIWALWPVRIVGVVSLAVNLVMIAATPVIGAHYMVDVIAGIALAALSIWLAERHAATLKEQGRTKVAAAAPALTWSES